MTESNKNANNSTSNGLNLKQNNEATENKSRLIDELPSNLKEKLVDMMNKLDEIEPLVEQIGSLQQADLKNQVTCPTRSQTCFYSA